MRNKQRMLNCLRFRNFCTEMQYKRLPIISTKVCLPKPEYNTEFLCDASNRNLIFDNIKMKKSIGDIDKVLEFSQKPESQNLLLAELKKIPNLIDPCVAKYGDAPCVLKECGTEPKFDFVPKEFSELSKALLLLRTEKLGAVAGRKSYVLIGDLAELEEALVHYTIKKLMAHKFKLVSVPDIIFTEVIERCGLIVNSERNLVYNLDSHYRDDLSLSGTAEMSLAAKLINKELLLDELPLKLAAVSRCYRAETSAIAEEKGIFRVHQFTKVEMFTCCEQEKSSEVLSQLQAIQEDLFLDLGLYFKVLDMPSHELGTPAYRKLDIEGWLPGRKIFGELSSCSNCTDYQSRRLNIKYRTSNGKLLHVHTLNGTACAIPRMLIAICETYQTEDGTINIPEKLVPFMGGKTIIKKQPIADMRFYRFKPKVR